MKKNKFMFTLVVILVLMIVMIVGSIAAPPRQLPVAGIVYQQDGSSQVETGLLVFINNTNLSLFTSTQTFGPPTFTGAYSGVINASENHLIYVHSYNETHWGYQQDVMGVSQVEINLNLNITRDSEPTVTILNPINNSFFSSLLDINVTANITIAGADGSFCNATLSFSNTTLYSLTDGTYTIDLGSLSRGAETQIVWNLTIDDQGVTNISVFSECRSDDVNLQGLDLATVYNVTNEDILPPIINIESPLNNSRVNSRFVVSYNVTDGSLLLNCSLAIDNTIVNVTLNPLTDTSLNISANLTQSESQFEINCTDTELFLGTSGLYNITLNQYPYVTTIAVDDPINLNAGSTKQVYCNGTFEDPDGYTDVINVSSVLYFETAQPHEDINASILYSNSSCTIENGVGNSADYICAFNVSYYAQNGSWTCNSTVIDSIDAINSSFLATTINPLLAVGITPTVIDFGNLEILQISPDDIEVNVTNFGNVPLDINLSAYGTAENDNVSMFCTTGNISYEYMRYSTLQSQLFSNMLLVNNSINPQMVDLNVTARKGGEFLVESTEMVYWKLQIPYFTSGQCSGRIFFEAMMS